MDKTYVHLIITDLPIFASILGGLVLAYGLWRKSDPTIIAAYWLMIFASVGAGVSYYTGGFAEETMKSLVEDFSESGTGSLIDEHRRFALYALIMLIVLGVFSLAGLFVTIKKYAISRTIAFILLVLSLVSFGLVAKTGSLGGEIRHTEIRSNSGGKSEGDEQEKGMKNEGGKGEMGGE